MNRFDALGRSPDPQGAFFLIYDSLLIVNAFYIKESRLSKLNPDTSIMG
jgi:hypothetical protein